MECNPLGLWAWLGGGRKEGKEEGADEEIPQFGERAIVRFLGARDR